MIRRYLYLRGYISLKAVKTGPKTAKATETRVKKSKERAERTFQHLLEHCIKTETVFDSKASIASFLNIKNFTAPRGGKWSKAQVKRVLDKFSAHEVKLVYVSVAAYDDEEEPREYEPTVNRSLALF